MILKKTAMTTALLTGCLFTALPASAFASFLHYGLRGYGAAGNYAFIRMVRPEFGTSLKISNNHREYVAIHARIAARNADPNGGVAGVLSLYAGDDFIHAKIADLPFAAGLYTGYQHLWYGHLYNNGIGGGLRLQTRILGLTLTGRVGALYGLSGTVGWHLGCAGNDFIFYGRAAYPVNRHLSVFAFARQERYVGNGNSLTARDAGLGLQAEFG